MTTLLQWLSLAILSLIIGAFAFTSVRHGVKVRPGQNHKTSDYT